MYVYMAHGGGLMLIMAQEVRLLPVYVCMHACVYVFFYVCMHACMCVCMFLCMYVYR